MGSCKLDNTKAAAQMAVVSKAIDQGEVISKTLKLRALRRVDQRNLSKARLQAATSSVHIKLPPVFFNMLHHNTMTEGPSAILCRACKRMPARSRLSSCGHIYCMDCCKVKVDCKVASCSSGTMWRDISHVVEELCIVLDIAFKEFHTKNDFSEPELKGEKSEEGPSSNDSRMERRKRRCTDYVDDGDSFIVVDDEIEDEMPGKKESSEDGRRLKKGRSKTASKQVQRAQECENELAELHYDWYSDRKLIGDGPPSKRRRI